MEAILRSIGLTENEVKIYIALLKLGSVTAYTLGQKTDIYRVHVYDKLEQLMEKGLVTQVYKGAKKHFQATPPEKLRQYLEEKKRVVERQEKEIEKILPTLQSFIENPEDEMRVEVFKGPEGIKYFLKDIIRSAKEVLIIGVNDEKYEKHLGVFMKQYFRDLRLKGIKERVITLKKPGIFTYDTDVAVTTEYRYLEEGAFNPANTFIYDDNVVIVSWGASVSAIMITNKGIAATYKGHFEQMWKIASDSLA